MARYMPLNTFLQSAPAKPPPTCHWWFRRGMLVLNFKLVIMTYVCAALYFTNAGCSSFVIKEPVHSDPTEALPDVGSSGIALLVLASVCLLFAAADAYRLYYGLAATARAKWHALVCLGICINAATALCLAPSLEQVGYDGTKHHSTPPPTCPEPVSALTVASGVLWILWAGVWALVFGNL